MTGIKECPFYGEACKMKDCELYSDRARTCSISLLSYNSFKVYSEMEDLGTRLELLDNNMIDFTDKLNSLNLILEDITYLLQAQLKKR
jgi:hypothetical protein